MSGYLSFKGIEAIAGQLDIPLTLLAVVPDERSTVCLSLMERVFSERS